ncbi:hypothetical protein DQ04_00151060 [Trypanosoma grayi]|uniref:hypothetical protein n=1 Tax=Trypanosoma grayi TaxID=71804 RepID=UPI0004F47426|nr:hypothetical protein DQ04_00151060 [Trypanosoma grayi]KEG15187.1 hypothetical protein DQ04_00151060 [Trypanosoma grayi]
MLGAGTLFIGIAVPTVAFGGFIASRKRLAYQWREELMDAEGNIYPAITETDMDFFRRVSPPHRSEGKGEPLTVKDNIGLCVCPDAISADERHVLLDEVRHWSARLGQKIDQRKVSLVESRAHAAGVDMSYYRDLTIISDHAEDIQLIKAPWGTGDRIKYDMMPSALRYLVDKTQRTFSGVGRLRHVYVEYSPSGKFYREPRATKAFDGHDYVVIPLRRDQHATVVTFSPLLRSKFAFVQEVLKSSWTSRDIDAIVPSGGALRVYGKARYEWAWGIRPCSVWFGHSSNSLPILSSSLDPCGFIERLRRRLFFHPRVKQQAGLDAALVVLHFEGPRDSNKQRSLLLQPEGLIFGTPPTPETYERWVEERPSEEAVREGGVFLFMVKNYLEMLRVS